MFQVYFQITVPLLHPVPKVSDAVRDATICKLVEGFVGFGTCGTWLTMGAISSGFCLSKWNIFYWICDVHICSGNVCYNVDVISTVTVEIITTNRNQLVLDFQWILVFKMWRKCWTTKVKYYWCLSQLCCCYPLGHPHSHSFTTPYTTLQCTVLCPLLQLNYYLRFVLSPIISTKKTHFNSHLHLIKPLQNQTVLTHIHVTD